MKTYRLDKAISKIQGTVNIIFPDGEVKTFNSGYEAWEDSRSQKGGNSDRYSKKYVIYTIENEGDRIAVYLSEKVSYKDATESVDDNGWVIESKLIIPPQKRAKK